jgi:hypothetical protein
MLINIRTWSCFEIRMKGRSDNMKIHNSSFKFRFLGTTVTNQNCIREEIKSRLKSGSACCHSVHFFFAFQFVIQKYKV